MVTKVVSQSAADDVISTVGDTGKAVDGQPDVVALGKGDDKAVGAPTTVVAVGEGDDKAVGAQTTVSAVGSGTSQAAGDDGAVETPSTSAAFFKPLVLPARLVSFSCYLRF